MESLPAIIGSLISIASLVLFIWRRVVARRAARAAAEVARLEAANEQLRGHIETRKKLDAVRIDDDAARLREKLRVYGGKT